jgi:hypothetical protein
MLKIARDEQLTDIISEDGSNPITTEHPIEGSTEDKVVYLFNDNSTKRYENVTIEVTGDDWVTITDEAEGTYTDSLTLGEIEGTDPITIYVRVTTPQVTETQNKTDIKLTVNYKEYAI